MIRQNKEDVMHYNLIIIYQIILDFSISNLHFLQYNKGKLVIINQHCFYMQIQYLQDKQFSQYNAKQIPKLSLINDLPQDIDKALIYITDRRRSNLKAKEKINSIGLRQIIKKNKVNLLEQNFIKKLKRIIIFKTIPEKILETQLNNNLKQGPFISGIKNYFSNTDGINLNGMYQTIWSVVNIIQTAIAAVIFSIILAFPQTAQFNFFSIIRIIGIILYLIDMILNFITQRQEMGKTIKKLSQIGLNYLENQFIPDIISLFMFPLSFAIGIQNMSIFLLVVALLKLRNNLKTFQKFQYLYITKSQRQQYYGLLKVFILNFVIGHFLSILLNLMANLSEGEQNWYDKVGIRNQQWHSKYIWGYYWGSTIMLTVGFGDISANNQTQALSLIFIETISCITLAYNINCVGNIIAQMKADNEEKKKKLKYFHKMCKQNKVCQDLQTKICNFIQQSYQIKQAFEFDEYQQVLQTLPKSIHSEYIKQCNKHLFQVPFFNSLNKKTILNLAQAVNRRITHPDQVIKKRGQLADFSILQKGAVGLVCKWSNKSALNGSIMQKFIVDEKQMPKIISLDFIQRKRVPYDIKSMYYSVIYFLQSEQFMQSLKECVMDYEHIFMMKDKDPYLMQQNQMYKCTVCPKQFHNKFSCPKYHYVPLNQHIINLYFKKIKNIKQPRGQSQNPREYRNKRCLHFVQTVAAAHSKYLQKYCQIDEIQEIQNMKRYYHKKTKNTQNNQIAELQTAQVDNFQKQMNKIEQLLVKQQDRIKDFWTIQLDVAFNFKYYFSYFNAINLVKTRINAPVHRKNRFQSTGTAKLDFFNTSTLV